MAASHQIPFLHVPLGYCWGNSRFCLD